MGVCNSRNGAPWKGSVGSYIKMLVLQFKKNLEKLPGAFRRCKSTRNHAPWTLEERPWRKRTEAQKLFPSTGGTFSRKESRDSGSQDQRGSRGECKFQRGTFRSHGKGHFPTALPAVGCPAFFRGHCYRYLNMPVHPGCLHSQAGQLLRLQNTVSPPSRTLSARDQPAGPHRQR